MLSKRPYLEAAYPPPLHPPAEFRRFVLHWNSRKTLRNPRKDEWQECQGVLFSDHNSQNRAVLSNGQAFVTQAEMEYVVGLGGDFRIEWIDQ